MVRRIWSELCGFVFPARCVGCDTPLPNEQPFCARCEHAVERNDGACARCATPLAVAASGTIACLACQQRAPPQATSRALALYGGAVATGLRRLKFGNRPDVASALGRWLQPYAWAAELIVPVPLGRARLAERGYNQAALLAFAAAADARLVVPRALRRIRATPPQAQLPLAERRANVRGAFVGDPRLIGQRRVLLIDDILTSGETVRAAAHALADAGASAVDVLTVARAIV